MSGDEVTSVTDKQRCGEIARRLSSNHAHQTLSMPLPHLQQVPQHFRTHGSSLLMATVTDD
eukprot:16442724-Heterocapsa_arctica.AAC.1